MLHLSKDVSLQEAFDTFANFSISRSLEFILESSNKQYLDPCASGSLDIKQELERYYRDRTARFTIYSMMSLDLLMSFLGECLGILVGHLICMADLNCKRWMVLAVDQFRKMEDREELTFEHENMERRY